MKVFWDFDASTKDGRHYIARNSVSSTTDRVLFARQTSARVRVHAMGLFFDIPMPLVHYYDASIATPYMDTDKCEGCLLVDAFGILPFEFLLYLSIFYVELSR
jgi:hypothetical protein